MPKLDWKRYIDYEKAKDCQCCIYVFRRDNTPLYIGKAKRFGGPKGRYAYGYRYVVQALIESNCRLYIAELKGKAKGDIDNYERSLIQSYKKYLVNKKIPKPSKKILGLKLPWRVS
jgi:hypothetical protein